MRFLKIILIFYSLLIICTVLLVVYEGSATSNKNEQFVIAYIVFLITSSVITIIYHIKSFRFYRRENKQRLDKKLSKFLWIGAISFYGILLFVFAQGVYNNWSRYLNGNLQDNDFLFIAISLIPSLIGLVEISFMKKRIKQLKAKRGVKEGINDIKGLHE